MEEQDSGDNVGMLVLEAKSLRPFRTKDEYLYAMKEDLAEWFTCLYKEICLNADNFLEILETGVLLCQHANEVRKFAEEQKQKGTFEIQSNFVRDIQIPQYDVQFRIDVKPGTFLARDNISNFITWTSKMGIPEVLRFETDDLVMRKNERSVVLCLLEVARVGAKFGMLAPTIVQMEEEIDNEIQTGEPPPQIKTCDVKSLDEMVRELVGRCTCPVQFPIVKVGEGKYKIGDNQTLVFVRILRKHVMIRVGGGWDTLEHYLDRHDPCRCGFQGHRGGRGASTPRRASTTTVSKSLPGTPKTSRKLSLTAPVNSTHSGYTPRPASPSMRSASPGPNSRKLSLTGKNTVPQPGQSVTSPNIVHKKPNFSNSGPNVSGKVQTVNQNGTTSSSGSFPVGSFVKQSQISLSRQLSSSSTGNQPPATPRRSASPTPRPQSPAQRRSESPAPVIANRLRSPSPAPMPQKGSNPVRPQSVPATQRCASPVKQITLSELRSSREGKVNNQTPSQTTPRSSRDGKLTSQTTPRTLRRQASTDSNKSRGSETEMMAEPGSSNFAIDKISTMSLGEFRSLLNSALSVPNGNTESQCSSDSPRSQGSVDSGRNISGKPKSTPAKSAYSYRSVSASRTQTGKPSIPAKPGIQSSTKPNISTPRTAQSSQNNVSISSRPTSAKSNYRSVLSSGYGQDRPKTPNSMPRSRSNTSSVSDGSYTLQSNTRSTFASRSSSHSSIQSCESTDDGRNSFGTDYGDQNIKALTPSSVDSDYSFRGSSCTSSDYARSNSYTPCSAAEEKIRLDKLQANARASSEPRENISSISRDIQNAYGVPESKPINVGYATFSYDKDDDSKDVNELDEIENEIIKSRDKSEDKSRDMTDLSKTDSSQSNARPQTPSGRQTPSFIPRPITPKVSRKLSLPQNGEPETLQIYDERKAAARPPTPKKSNIIARAHGTTGVRSADKSKEQTYRELFQKRSTTPGPGSTSSSGSVAASARRSMTPGPYLNKTSTLRPTSATTNRARLNEAMEETKGTSLSVFSENKENSNISSTKRTQIIDKKTLMKQKSIDQTEAVIMVNVDRSEGRHSLSVQGENEPRHSANKSKVLARARTEDNRARTPTRTTPGITRQRPQSVEPRQLIPRKPGNNAETVLTVKRNENGTHGVYDRTQEWVQTAVEQTKVVQKTKVNRTYTLKLRRAMTPNSFDMRIDQEKEEPRSLDEIKAALTLPINGLNELNPDKLDAPPEDPEMYATMEKLFHELRQQELKNSVNETPGNNATSSKGAKSKSSKSNSSNNDEEMSLDSNRNIKSKTLSVSTKSLSNVTSPPMQRSSRTNANSNQTEHGKSMSRTSSTSSASASQFSNSQAGQGNQYTKKSAPSGPVSTPRASRPSSPGPSARRPPSPRTTTHTTPRPESPRVTSHPPRPASPRLNSHPPRPASPRVSPQTSRPASPSFRNNSDSSRGSTPSRTQPPRPASTPPRAYSPVVRQSSKSSEDNDSVFDKEKKSDAGSIMKKIKEIIKVNPRKDKIEGVTGKSRIPAPKSLASVGRSRSVSNLSNLTHSFSVSSEESNGYSFEEHNMNGYGEYINGGLNVTLSGRSETPKPKLNTPLTTGRSSLIRKESMEKNKSNVANKLVRAMSVERNMSGLNNTYHYYDEGEYV